MSLPSNLTITGNILFLTEDQGLIRAQLEGNAKHGIDWLSQPLCNNISTDEIIPGWCCYWYDEALSNYAYCGLRGGSITQGAVNKYRPAVIVSGESKGCGSSREHAPYAEKYAGVQLIVAKSFEKIYEQNCRNIGILTTTDFSVLNNVIRGEPIPLSVFIENLSDINKGIVHNGGLFAYNKQRKEGKVTVPVVRAAPRPLNIVEKIIQSHINSQAENGDWSVAVGETYFCNTDVRFSHEYVTPMAEQMYKVQFGETMPITEARSVFFFNDHLSLSEHVLASRDNGPTLIARTQHLAESQSAFAQEQQVTLYGLRDGGGSQAICHNAVLEDIAEPGQIVIGTDSHTCTAGALGCLAFGVGTTDMANAWLTKDVQVSVPKVIRIHMTGSLSPWICAKDIVLTLLAHPLIQNGETLKSVLYFTGPACLSLSMDERATLCNMAVEMGATTALFAADDVTWLFLQDQRARLLSDFASPGAFAPLLCDDGANYWATIDIDLSSISTMIALPGDPRNAIPFANQIGGRITINKAYGGSCTGGKNADMDMYAAVFQLAQTNGIRVPPEVALYIQFGSESVMAYAASKDYIALFEAVGAQVIPPSCGACINAGPGVSTSGKDVTISAQNRNFPGRSGPGEVYLASPYIVAASALVGFIATPEQVFSNINSERGAIGSHEPA